VETGRGRKSKKTGWRLTLGPKEAIFAGIGMVGLMMMSFALGALAGRGDIYRAAYSWGLMSPAGPKVAQWTPGLGVPPGPVAAAPATATAPGAPPAPVAAAPAPKPAVAPAPHAPAPVAAKHGKPGVVAGSITALSPPVPTATAKKKGKSGNLHKDHKTREEEVRRARQEMVPKLKFLNSFDNTPKTRLPKPKEHEKAQAKSQPKLVRVAEYRHSREAQAKVAELRKKGIKATVKKTKDSKGTLYIVYKPGASHLAEKKEKLARKPEKSSGSAKQPRIE
jgi:hypothetical protein